MNHRLSRALPPLQESKDDAPAQGFFRRIRRLAVALSGVVSIALLVLGSRPLWAQESTVDQSIEGAASDQPDASTGSETEQAETPSPEGPAQQPRFFPRLRPKVLTPEEREEAERLKRL